MFEYNKPFSASAHLQPAGIRIQLWVLHIGSCSMDLHDLWCGWVGISCLGRWLLSLPADLSQTPQPQPIFPSPLCLQGTRSSVFMSLILVIPLVLSLLPPFSQGFYLFLSVGCVCLKNLVVFPWLMESLGHVGHSSDMKGRPKPLHGSGHIDQECPPMTP